MDISTSYRYSTDWFESQRAVWEEVFSRLGLLGMPGINYLEIGVFEGASLFWMMDHVVTHPTSRAWAVDTFFHPEVFEKNLARCSGRQRITVLKGESKDILRALPLRAFDVIFIDGNHDLKSVMTDIAFSWDLLKEGGVLALDDYGLDREFQVPCDLVPRKAQETFLLGYGEEIDVLCQEYQIFVRKKSSRRKGDPCIFIGDYRYWFYEQRLTDRDLNPIEISGTERELLRKYTSYLQLSYVPAPNNPILRMSEFQALLQRLGVT